ncbi:MAG: TetR/AcrR family transcriptional regulator [Bacteroidota bacterium]
MSDTKSKIINVAEELIRTRGYNGFSYRDIATVLSIKNAAIHYHFPSKADLGVAVVQRTRENFSQFVSQSDRNMDASAKLKKFIDIYSESQQKNLVCFMGALGPTFSSLPKEMQQELSSASQEIRSWMTSILAEGKQRNQFTFQGAIVDQADSIISSLLASLILNKVTSEDILGNVIRQIDKTI